MKFIHCADIHLDTPLQGLAEYPGAPLAEIRNATRRAFEKVLDAALSEKVDFLIIAGDLYDTGLKSFESALYFNAQIARLKDAGIPVYLIHGNHDAANKLIKQLRPPSNVHIFRASEPQTVFIKGLHVALHGQSFATQEVTEDLAARYPAPVPDWFNIGVLHTNLSGISDHANYAPCSLDTLRNKGYQYWALGHVHHRQILCDDPYIVFPGNIQGRHGKEQGEKSCELVTVSDAGAITLEMVPTSVVPWVEIEIDAASCENADDVYDNLRGRLEETLLQAKERISAVRLLISGQTEAHAELNRDPDEVRNAVISIANEWTGLLWIERVRVATSPRIDRAALLRRDDPVGEVLRILDGLRADPTSIAALGSVEDLRKKLPSEISESAEPIALDAATLGLALEEAEGLLLARLAALEAV